MKNKDKITYGITLVIIVIVLIGMYNPFVDEIESSRLDENHCLEEEMYYYRWVGGFIFDSRHETTKENADDFDYRCVRWKESPSMSSVILGQEMIHNKGSLYKKAK